MSKEEELKHRAERLSEIQKAYRTIFMSPAGQMVFEDLGVLCKAHGTTFDADPYIHAALAGRREVFLHIAQQLALTQEQLLQLSFGKSIRVIYGDEDDA